MYALIVRTEDSMEESGACLESVVADVSKSAPAELVDMDHDDCGTSVYALVTSEQDLKEYAGIHELGSGRCVADCVELDPEFDEYQVEYDVKTNYGYTGTGLSSTPAITVRATYIPMKASVFAEGMLGIMRTKKKALIRLKASVAQAIANNPE